MYISAVVITKNAGKTLNQCLTALSAVADEIIIADSGSSDDTLNIAAQHGCQIMHTTWLGYGATKNMANAAARFGYILSADADEVLDATLQQAILRTKNSLSGVYAFRRLNVLCGTIIKHGLWYPDVKVRLFPKHVLWNEAAVHEVLLLPQGLKQQELNGALLHYTALTYAEFINKQEQYALLAAKRKIHKPKAILALQGLATCIFTFIKGYILKKGFLDKGNGLMVARCTSLYAARKYWYAMQDNLRKPS